MGNVTRVNRVVDNFIWVENRSKFNKDFLKNYNEDRVLEK